MENNLMLGDILIIDRGLYKHYAIYAGDGKVIHYSGSLSDWGGDISICETTLENFAKDKKFVVGKFTKNFIESHNVFSPEETVARARSRLGERAYNLISNNCEHFALWCKLGVSRSVQVENVFDFCSIFDLSFIENITAISNELFGSDERFKTLPIAPITKIDTLTFEQVLQFFKQEKILKELSENKNLIAVVLKNKSKIVLCVYDKEKNTTNENFIVYETDKLDTKLQDLFADKNMIVLE